MLVRLRFSETDPGQVTGYAVTLPGHTGPDGAPAWYGGGRLAAGLTLPQLRRRWSQARSSSRGARRERSGSPPRNATPIYAHASRQAAAAAEHIRRCAHSDPAAAADAAWAAADTLHVAARALRSPELRCAADAYDRAARAPHGRLPRRSRDGDQLRRTARLIAWPVTSPGTARSRRSRSSRTWSPSPPPWPNCGRPSSTPRRQPRPGKRLNACVRPWWGPVLRCRGQVRRHGRSAPSLPGKQMPPAWTSRWGCGSTRRRSPPPHAPAMRARFAATSHPSGPGRNDE